jgi:hypothetical protein
LQPGHDGGDLIGHAKRFRPQRVGGNHRRYGVHSAAACAVNKLLPDMQLQNNSVVVHDRQLFCKVSGRGTPELRGGN